MSMFTSPPKNISVKKHSQLLNNPIQLKNINSNPDIWIVVEEPLDNYYKRVLKNYLNKEFPDISYIVVSALLLKPIEKDNLSAKFYIKNRTILEGIIPKGAKIISVGKSIISICQSDDLIIKTKGPDDYRNLIEGFYDTLLGNTYFFSPDLQAKIFPIDSIDSWLGKDNFEKEFSKKQITKAINDEWIPRRKKKITKIEVENPNKWLLDRVNGIEDIAWDLETQGLDCYIPDKKIICFTCTFDGDVGYYLDFDKIDTNILGLFLKGRRGILTNGKYDLKWLVVKANIPRNYIFIYSDTMHLSHTINEMKRMGAKSSVWQYTEDLGGYNRPLDKYLEEHPECKEDYNKIPKDILIPYAILDPCVSWRCNQAMLRELKQLKEKCPVNKCHTYLKDSQWDIERYYFDVIMRSVRTFCNVELNGIELNLDVVDELSAKVDKEIKEIKTELNTRFNLKENEIDWGSNTKIGRFLEKQRWKDHGRNKSKAYYVNDDSLRKWVIEGHKEAQLILDLHEKNTLMRTFIGKRGELVKRKKKGLGSGYYQYVKPDGKIHANFGVALTNTNRNNCSNPNLQNQKKRGYLAKEIRSYSKPPSNDFLIGELDGSGFQLRIVASLSGDEEMKKVFNSPNDDLHSMTAQMLFKPELTLDEFFQNLKNKETKDEYKLLRYSGKGPNFSLIFNSTPMSFATQTLMSGPYAWKEEQVDKYLREQLNYEIINSANHDEEYILKKYVTVAEDIKEKFFEKYVGVRRYIDYIISFAEKNGYTVSPFGTTRRLPYLTYHGSDTNGGKYKNQQNIATNSPVQAYEFFLIMRAMNAIDDKIYDVDIPMNSVLIGQVHDSIAGFFHKKEIYELCKLAKETFEEDIPENRGIPNVLELEIGEYEKEEYWGFSPEKTLENLYEEYTCK